MNERYAKFLGEVGVEPTSLEYNDRVMIFDGLNLFIRNWSANPLMNDDGEPYGGVVGSLKSLSSVIKLFSPTRVIVVFDGKGGSDKRKKIYTGYKEDRNNNKLRINRQYEGMLSDAEELQLMRDQFIAFVDILNHLPVCTMIFDGIEADDVIAYISKNLSNNSQTYIVSSDKDFLQLVDDSTFVYSPTKKKLYDINTVRSEYNIYPNNLALFRALDGDKSDNVPGVKGCGLKTLCKYIPEITEPVERTVDEIIDIARTRKFKMCTSIVEHEDVFRRNFSIMQLSDTIASPDSRFKIISRFNEKIPSVNLLDFIKVLKNYRITTAFSDIHGWLRSTFIPLNQT